ncbi:MAG: hypothetical protein HYS86_01750 [Candidatus Chisholmbacteria bacterium]|nr:hypothetical protein [Candidatus Chisholmbacteria bacterium]
MKQDTGTIIGVEGQVVEVNFSGQQPAADEVVVVEEADKARMVVYATAGENPIRQAPSMTAGGQGGRYYCVALERVETLTRGMTVERTNEGMKFPVGRELLGRAVNVFGEPEDGDGEMRTLERWLTKKPASPYDSQAIIEKVMPTGIKVLDFFVPMSWGGKMGLFGGAGVGKTMLLREMLHNLVGETGSTRSTRGTPKSAGATGQAKGMESTGSTEGDPSAAGRRTGARRTQDDHVERGRQADLMSLSRLSSEGSEDARVEGDRLDGQKTVSVYAGVGERSREGQELYAALKESGALPGVAFILGEMGHNSARRFMTAFAAVTLAEYLRDAMKKNVLFFMDNMFRFAQAGNELSTLMNTIPSEDGYQATLESEMASLHERLSSNADAVISSVEAIYVPSDDLLDQGVQAVFPYLDSMVILSRDVYQQGLLPAVDILRSTSSSLDPELVGEKHYETALEARRVLKEAERLSRIVSLVGEAELAPSDQLLYQRAQKLRNFMTQRFFVSGGDGSAPRLPIETLVDDVADLLKGKYDTVSAEKFLYIGTLKEIVPKAQGGSLVTARVERASY